MIKTVFNFRKLQKLFVAGLFAAGILFAGCDNGTKDTNNLNNNPGPITAKTNETFTVPATSVEMAKAMKIGWNLGNTFDAWSDNATGLSSETCWGQPKTTKAMIHGIKQAGFVSIRIPVSWHDHITDATNYTIDTAWMNRVKEVVDWALDEGLCVILNIHHDNFSDADLKNRTYGFAVSKDEALQEKSKNYIAGVWKNIAEVFKDYDYKLVFEVLNEPRDIGGTNWGQEWWVGGANATEANGIICAYEQVGLNAIRKSGSKNADRFVMCPPYAASTSCMTGFSLPTDTATSRLMIEAHAYSPYSFAMDSPGETEFTSAHKTELTNMFNNLYNNYVSQGIGVVIDETGATNKENLEDRIEWAKYFFGEAYKKGIPSLWWDNGVWQVSGTKYNEHYGYYNRTQQIWYFPELMKASLKAVGVEFEETETTDASSTESPSGGDTTSTNYTAEDLVILENKTVFTDGKYASFALDNAVDLTNYKYLKIEISSPNADNADQRQLFVQGFNSAWKEIGSIRTMSVSATKYLEIQNPAEGNRDIKYIQYAAQNTSTWDDTANIQIQLKKITATNNK